MASHASTKADLERMLSDENVEGDALQLPLQLLDCITNGFSGNHEIGIGGFAVVYKGQLENGAVAVKKLSQKNVIDDNKFRVEVDCLMKAKHKNIVRFLGYCYETQRRLVQHNGKSVMAEVPYMLLCFEYLPNGSLDKYIEGPSLEWKKCYQIIKGLCEGLCCLHDKQIVHSDLKPANILLGDDMVPKIADFGISRCFDEGQTHATTKNILGSKGYMAPEFYSGNISFKSDIFSLGVIIIQIITGKNWYPDITWNEKGYPVDIKDVLKRWRHKVGKSQEEQIRVCTEVDQSCLDHDPVKRPSAQCIIDILKRTETTTKNDLERMLFDESMEVKALPLSLLKCITDDFSDNLKIGCGGFAVVYKGLLENGAVAVKKLSQPVIDDMKFHSEVCCLMKVKHKNIVRFLGYCSDTQGQWVKYNEEFVMADVRQRLLCFEYLPKKGLDKYIKDSSLEWGKCYQIIKGVCEGLCYLHQKQIVHSDLKPANILLDNDMVPKITDFGISRCLDGKQTHTVTENIIGSKGYLSPEVLYGGKISFKSDTFSLGVIITEILTANKDYPDVKDVLQYWGHKVEKSQEEHKLEQIRVCTEVAQSCLEYYPANRPSAQDIIDKLKQTERKERRIENGASNSTVSHASSHVEDKSKSSSSTIPQACSVVQNKNKPPWRRNLMIEAFRPLPLDPVIAVRARMAVTHAICKFYAQVRLSVSSFEELNRHGYNLVVYNKGKELYSAVEATMTTEVQSLCRPLDSAPADGAGFLQELLAKWNQHTEAVNFTRDILMYMDQTFVVINHKTPIKELGLRLWRDQMARSDKIKPKLIEAVKRQRGGEDELVAGVNKMLAELGAEVMEAPCLFFRDSAGKLHAAGP